MRTSLDLGAKEADVGEGLFTQDLAKRTIRASAKTQTDFGASLNPHLREKPEAVRAVAEVCGDASQPLQEV